MSGIQNSPGGKVLMGDGFITIHLGKYIEITGKTGFSRLRRERVNQLQGLHGRLMFIVDRKL